MKVRSSLRVSRPKFISKSLVKMDKCNVDLWHEEIDESLSYIPGTLTQTIHIAIHKQYILL